MTARCTVFAGTHRAATARECPMALRAWISTTRSVMSRVAEVLGASSMARCCLRLFQQAPVLLLLLGMTLHADTLVLRNGTRVSGRWWAVDAKVVSFFVKDHLEFYPRPDVAEVVFGDSTTTNSAEPTPKENQARDNRTQQK